MEFDKRPNFIILLVLILFLPILVAILVSIHIVNLPTSNDWIGFYAAIISGLIGGLLTYYSVYISLSGVDKQIREQKVSNDLFRNQLNNDNKIYKEEQRLNVRPYVSDDYGEDNKVINLNAVVFEIDEYTYTYTDDMIINIKNIGVGPLISLMVIGIREGSENNNLIESMHSDIKSIEVGGTMKLNISYMNQQEYLMNTLYIEIQYFDILDNQYKQMIEITLHRDNAGRLEKCKTASVSKQQLIVNI